MDEITKKICISETTKFYAKNAESFSQTRSNSWAGWEKLLQYICKQTPIKVLDLACGNMRFIKYLSENDIKLSEATCIDNCPALIPDNLLAYANYLEKNIYDLIEDKPLNNSFDVSVSFGLMHHIPTFELRLKLLNYLIDSTKKTGIIAISCWNFLQSGKIRDKAIRTTEIAERLLSINLEDDNDYFLNWQDDYETFRFCHNITEIECLELAKRVEGKAELVDMYRADGKSENLNLYLVFKKQL